MNLLDPERSLISADLNVEDAFSLLQEISRQVAEDPRADQSQHLVILALDRREAFPVHLRPIIDALVEALGLYPYLSPNDLSSVDLLRYEFNRPVEFDRDVVFHAGQSEVYRLLMQGESVVLTAPTSFGKSMLIDAVIFSGMYSNLVVVVPTIALLDETRRRFERFRPRYQIITHPSQRLGERNVFVLTQERLLEFPNLPSIDFFVIDEFYKLSPRKDDMRYTLLNVALYRLLKTAKAFYLIGPTVSGLDPLATPELRARLIHSNFKTVTTIVERVAKRDRNLAGLVRICGEQHAASLVYCASPESARTVAKALAAEQESSSDGQLLQAAEWVEGQYHADWSFATCLKKGVGLHHGRIPRALQQMAVRMFDEGMLKYLVCTSTLIEGVNTAAKNVMIYDKRVGRNNFDFFTFANIRGRAGRMSRHFVGRVFLFKDPPEEDLPMVEIPVLSQPNDLSMEVIIEMDYQDLGDNSKDRLTQFQTQSDLPMSVVRESLGVDPDKQVALAKRVASFSNHRLLARAWSGRPNGDQIDELCELVWTSFFEGRRYGVSSGRQLASRLKIASVFSVRDWIQRDVATPDSTADQVVEDTLEFLRYWCGFAFPRYARAVERILRNEQSRRGLQESDYSVYLGQVEATFLHPMVAALDEYGIPTQIAGHVNDLRALPNNLDDAADVVRQVAATGALSDFERQMVAASLGTVVIGQERLNFESL